MTIAQALQDLFNRMVVIASFDFFDNLGTSLLEEWEAGETMKLVFVDGSRATYYDGDYTVE